MKIIKEIYIYDYFDSYPNLQCNLDPIVLTIYNIIKSKRFVEICPLVTQIMSVGHKIVLNSFFSPYFHLIKNMFFLVSPAVLVVTDNLSNFQDFLIF